MKITGGQFRGRTITCPAGTRPVSTKVRQACFDMLGDEVQGKNILDLCAGSGALGLEALSRGAQSAVFVDNRAVSIQAIKKNIAVCQEIEHEQVLLKDAVQAIQDFHKKGVSYDIIFADPPYYKGIMRKILQALTEYDIVAPHGYIICFCYNKDKISPYEKKSKGEIFCHVKEQASNKKIAVSRESSIKSNDGEVFSRLFVCLVDKNYGQTRLLVYNKI